MTPITSLQNPRVKDAVRLRDRRHRRKQGRILVDGSRELLRAIEAGVNPIETFICPAICQSDDSRRLLEMLPRLGGEVFEVNEAVFDKLSFGDRAEGILAVAAAPRATLSSLITPRPLVAPGGATNGRGFVHNFPENALVAVLEAVEKPGNVGAVLRSADAAGVSALIAADPKTDLHNPNAIRASLGTIFTMPVREATGEETLDWLRQNRFRILAARVDGSVPYTEVDYRGPTAIVLGSEADGLSPLWHGDDIQAIRLPMLGDADSLNISATAAVLFYEALRQRIV